VRILFVSHYALPHLGGIESVVDALAAELAGRGHRVAHVASDSLRGEDGRAEAPKPGYEIARLRALNVAERRLGVPYPVFSPRGWRALEREVAHADVVHAHGLLYMSSVAALLGARARRPGGPARVLTEHVGRVGYEHAVLDATERAAIATVGRTAVCAAQTVIVLNDRVRSEVAALDPHARVELVPNGVDTERFRPAGEEERLALRARLGWDARPRVLFVGRLVAKKGIDVALATARAAGGAFELVVAGPGRFAAPGAGVEVLGSRSRDELAVLYRAADAFLLPSRGEGFPVTAQEAMASGLPVVLREDPAYAAYVPRESPGLLLLPPDPGEIARRLRGLLADPATLGEARADVAARARAVFSWSRAADEHERIYAAARARR